MPSMHISIPDELHAQLKNFANNRLSNMSEVIRYALAHLFTLEDIDARKDAVLQQAVNRRFSVPRHIPIKSFYIFIYLLAHKYPKESSRDFWTQAIYLDSNDKTHAQVLLEIKQEMEQTVAQFKGSPTQAPSGTNGVDASETT